MNALKTLGVGMVVLAASQASATYTDWSNPGLCGWTFNYHGYAQTYANIDRIPDTYGGWYTVASRVSYVGPGCADRSRFPGLNCWQCETDPNTGEKDCGPGACSRSTLYPPPSAGTERNNLMNGERYMWWDIIPGWHPQYPNNCPVLYYTGFYTPFPYYRGGADSADTWYVKAYMFMGPGATKWLTAGGITWSGLKPTTWYDANSGGVDIGGIRGLMTQNVLLGNGELTPRAVAIWLGPSNEGAPGHRVFTGTMTWTHPVYNCTITYQLSSRDWKRTTRDQ
jgi:hypothetical protein